MTTTSNVFLANYNSSKFDITLKADVTGAPTWVQYIEPNKLFAVNENGNDLHILNLECGSTYSLTPAINATGSSGVVHLGFNKDNTRLVSAAYGNRTVDVWDISSDRLRLIKTIPAPGNSGPRSPNQDTSHPHQANLNPSGRYFAINDLGFDNIMILDTQDNKYDIIQNIPTKAGYVICEISNEIIVNQISYSAAGVTIHQSQIISSFISGTAPKGAAAGGIVLHPNQKDLYITNRLTGGNGVLPRMLSISKSGKEIFLSNQDGPAAAVAFGINEDSSIDATPKATLDLSVFSEKGSGPPYITEI
ncbi:unnamed protein product [Clonostachys chloroleuca]|uniref:Uncharacterized protein n=1 Tax=Clonostachys chloroleuca TaxID=1926264 RepID=A0AA35M772_9HYPO|nr:unnamed protein product [Clonostachys chloroleuca]